jgi:hypothetical protein
LIRKIAKNKKDAKKPEKISILGILFEIRQMWLMSLQISEK